MVRLLILGWLIVAVGNDESAYFLSHPVTVIGRAAESDVRVDDPGARSAAPCGTAAEPVISLRPGSSCFGLRR